MSDLSDLAIIKAIAEIEGDIDTLESFAFYDLPQHQTPFYQDHKEKVLLNLVNNPLTNDAMSFELMIKHKVNVSHSDSAYSQAVIYAKGTTDEDEPLSSVDFFNDGCSYNRAICIAIIEANAQ